jgi:hypothetical protein
LRVRIGVEPRLVAQSGRTEMSGYLSAFGVKRTCAMVRLRPPRSRLTHNGHGPARNFALQQSRPQPIQNISGFPQGPAQPFGGTLIVRRFGASACDRGNRP